MRTGISGDEAISYEVIDSPYGQLLLAISTRGLVKIGLDEADFDAELAALSRTFEVNPVRDSRPLQSAIGQLEEYFAGQRQVFDLSLDHRLASGFRQTVQQALADIPYGETASYGEVAADIGRPRASRAVGTACATNPLPLVLPCHRVVRSDGSVGHYGGGPAMKVTLLDLEKRNRAA